MTAMETANSPPVGAPVTAATASSASGQTTDAPLISLHWEDVSVSVSIVGTSAQQPSKQYSVFPELDPNLPSRKDLRPIKLGKGLIGGAGGGGGGTKAAPLRGNTTKSGGRGNSSGAAVGALKKCHICQRGFNKMSYLKRHIQSHSSVKPYQCDICGWGFFQFCNLKRHMTSHSVNGGSGYKCTHCNAAFSTKSVLSVHMRDSHASKIPPKATTNGTATNVMDNHLSAASKQLLKTNNSINNSSSNSSPLVRTSSHPDQAPKIFGCTHCGEKFNRMALLNKHIASHEAEINLAAAAAAAADNNAASNGLKQ